MTEPTELRNERADLLPTTIDLVGTALALLRCSPTRLLIDRRRLALARDQARARTTRMVRGRRCLEAAWLWRAAMKVESNEEQRAAAATKVFGETYVQSARMVEWVKTGINADDHTGLDLNGADDLADLLASREAPLIARISDLEVVIEAYREANSKEKA